MIMNDDGGNLIWHVVLKQKKGRLYSSYHVAMVEQFWQWIALTCLALNEGVRSGICEIFLRQRALSLLAVYSRSSDTNCNAHEARVKDATSKKKYKLS